jgi:Spy/CpxP family protein refolding chaperone
MRYRILTALSVTVLAAGMLLADTPAAPNHPGQGRGVERMATVLGLTDAQKTQAQAIFTAERQAVKPLFQQVRTVRQSLHTAATGGGGDVDQLSSQLGTLTGQLSAIHTKSIAQFYALLTPDQQTKAQALFPRMLAGHRGMQN